MGDETAAPEGGRILLPGTENALPESLACFRLHVGRVEHRLLMPLQFGRPVIRAEHHVLLTRWPKPTATQDGWLGVRKLCVLGFPVFLPNLDEAISNGNRITLQDATVEFAARWAT